MNAATIIAVAALVCILFLASRYIVREKRKGTRCIGCPYAGEAGCHCHCQTAAAQKKSCCH